jgi:hypothetical protein
MYMRSCALTGWGWGREIITKGYTFNSPPAFDNHNERRQGAQKEKRIPLYIDKGIHPDHRKVFTRLKGENSSSCKINMMQIFIRRIENKAHEYFAYLKGLHGKATYLLYFSDDIYGAISLSQFVQMLKGHFKANRIDIQFQDDEISIKSQALLAVLSEERSGWNERD